MAICPISLKEGEGLNSIIKFAIDPYYSYIQNVTYSYLLYKIVILEFRLANNFQSSYAYAFMMISAFNYLNLLQLKKHLFKSITFTHNILSITSMKLDHLLNTIFFFLMQPTASSSNPYEIKSNSNYWCYWDCIKFEI